MPNHFPNINSRPRSGHQPFRGIVESPIAPDVFLSDANQGLPASTSAHGTRTIRRPSGTSTVSDLMSRVMREDFVLRVPIRPAAICAVCKTTMLETKVRVDGSTFLSCAEHGVLSVQSKHALLTCRYNEAGHIEIRDPFLVGSIDCALTATAQESLHAVIRDFYWRALQMKRQRQAVTLPNIVDIARFLEWGIT